MEPGPGCVAIADTLIRDGSRGQALGGLSAKRQGFLALGKVQADVQQAAGRVSPHNIGPVIHGVLHHFLQQEELLLTLQSRSA